MKIRRIGFVVLFLLVAGYWLLATCHLPLATCHSPLATLRSPLTFKLGLVAPFEGRYRPIGYDAIYAARLAVRQVNATGGAGGYRIELIAFDDGGNPDTAAWQAHMLALDPDVMGVVGHLRTDTTLAAAEVYAETGLPLVVPASVPADGLPSAVCLGPMQEQLAAALDGTIAPTETVRFILNETNPIAAAQSSRQARVAGGPDLALADFARIAGPAAAGTLFATGAPWPQDVADSEQFIADYKVVSGGTPPGPYAWATYRAVLVLLQAVEQDIRANGYPSRRGVQEQLCAGHACGEAGHAPVYVYRYDAAGQPQRVK